MEAVRQSTVTAQVSGRVVAVNFDAGNYDAGDYDAGDYDAGDYVKAGAVLIRLAAQESASAAAGSRAQVNRQAALDRATAAVQELPHAADHHAALR